jgi:hypothetical protein
MKKIFLKNKKENKKFPDFYLGGKKAGLQISFAWLFAIIVGAIILFLAIYLSVRIVDSGEELQDAKTGKQIGILLNPLETGFESAKTSSISFPVDTRIHNLCSREGYFGTQGIKISQKSRNKWTSTKTQVEFLNKYIFSEKTVEGRDIILFSKPFEFPFKISDLIYIFPSSQNFCFRDSPEEIERELSQIGHKNLKTENCSKTNAINVCFNLGAECDILVNYDSKYVEKNKTKMYFEGNALMYAAIFSSPEVYECQLKRLMKKIEIISRIYIEKASFVAREGCNSNMQSDLSVLGASAGSFANSQEIISLSSLVREAGIKNKNAECRLW